MRRIILRLFLTALGFDSVYLGAQCSGCSLTFTDNSVGSYTVTSGQTLCIAPNFTYTGNLTLNGGKICNDGTVTKVVFKAGTFNNNPGASVNATSKSNLFFALSSKVILNNYSGALFLLSDSLKVTANSSDSLVVNNFTGASISTNNLLVITARVFFNIGLAATTTTQTPFVTTFNLNGNGVFKKGAAIIIKEGATMNITGKLEFIGEGNKIFINHGSVSIGDSLNIKGNGADGDTVAIRNYGDATIYGSIYSSISNSIVDLHNYAEHSTSLLYVQDLDLKESNMSFVNDDVLLLGGSLNIYRGLFDNNHYMEAGSINNDYGTITNDSVLFLAGDLNINGADGVFNNNSKIVIPGTLTNHGTVNLGIYSAIVTENFQNYSPGTIVGGSSLSDQELYPAIFVNNSSYTSGDVTGDMFFIDKSNSGPGAFDVVETPGTVSNDVQTTFDCRFFRPGFIGSSSPYSKRLRTTYCYGETVQLSFVPYLSYTGSVSWTVNATAVSIPFTTGLSISMLTVTGSGWVQAGATFSVVGGTCNLTTGVYITVVQGSITATSPLYFGSGSTLAITPTISFGTPPLQFAWNPNYFIVAPTMANSPTVAVAPQVSFVYTVSYSDGYGCGASTTVEVIGEPFARLDKELNGEYYKLTSDNKLYFKHYAQYDNSSLNYFVYDKKHEVAASSTGTNILNTLSLFPGDNRLALDANGLPTGYYVLEVINEKKEKMYLRFKR